MISKIVNLQKQVSIGEGVNRKDIVFLNAQMSSGYGTYSISIQVLDKGAILENEELVKTEIANFENEVKKEAILNGWDIMRA